MQSMNNFDVGRHFNNNLTKKQWRTLYKNTMHFSARNLSYRMIHQQSSTKLAFTQRYLPNADSDRCDLCNEVEDAKHLFISCVLKLVVWDSSFNEFLSSPKSVNPHHHAIYRSIMRFKLDHYLIFSSPDHVTIYDIFATIMRMIWRNHYQQFYHFIPFDSLQVLCRQIRTELNFIFCLDYVYDFKILAVLLKLCFNNNFESSDQGLNIALFRLFLHCMLLGRCFLIIIVRSIG
ncbi:hypothetical protein HMPREF1544_11991 [Mucor circinelloides 1006PhL]|uniref:Reverse transcriptase zinc-binding domain-containing protein n=1 Tax=Mucor circinelloides f. circinelloides (strain 1006PhL) TaxID=1220926 RepID=S2IZI7_MUCC1|nr:hypothetical protein HMPREF1544_11991 [Mucor circinelloides 1006PhL]